MNESVNLNKEKSDNSVSSVQPVDTNNLSFNNNTNSTFSNPNSVNKYDNIEFNNPDEQLAGFWLRFLAHIIDVIALTLITIVPLVLIFFVLVAVPVMNENSIDSLFTLVSIVVLALVAALFESSKYQATPGKMCLGLIVVDRLGERMPFGSAYGRTLIKYATMIFGITGFIHIMAAFTRKKQSIQDMALNAYVVKKSHLEAIKEYNQALRALNGLNTSSSNRTNNVDKQPDIIL